jgi:hypothetical protein
VPARGFRRRRGHAIVWLASSVGIACLASCSATDETPGGRVGHPTPYPGSPARGAGSSPQAAPDASPPGTALSPLDTAIANDFPARPWSKNVPDRACGNDGECGDGFCDRGRCAPIWTWDQLYGQRCGAFYKGRPCGAYLCLEGRCRSCVSHAECVARDGSGLVCSDAGAASKHLGSSCGLLGPNPHTPPEPVRTPATP